MLIIRTYFLKFAASSIAALVLFFVASAAVLAVAQGYESSDPGLRTGMVAMLDEAESNDNPKVKRATQEKLDKVVGVTTDSEDSAVTIASPEQSIYIESGGEVSVYVSDVNGEVRAGDQLVLSAVSGVLAKYTEGSLAIFAIALENMPAGSAETYQVEGADGSQETKVVRMRVNFDQSGALGGSGKGTALERLGQNIVGKEVSEVRVAVALVIFTIILIAEGAILYGAISSAISSIGRNPLAGKQIRRELIKVVVIAFAVLIFGLGSIYIVLWV